MSRLFLAWAPVFVLIGCGRSVHGSDLPDSASVAAAEDGAGSNAPWAGSSSGDATSGGGDSSAFDSTFVSADGVSMDAATVSDATVLDVATGIEAATVFDVATLDADADVTDPVAAPCTPTTQQCAGEIVETCDPDGGWANPWTCATARCGDGGCAGSTTAAPSCAEPGPGVSDCGLVDGGAESCCTSLEVTGATFYQGYACCDSGVPAGVATTTVSGFRLDKYLVSVGRFRQYVRYLTSSAGAPPPNGSGTHAHLNGGLGLVDQSTFFEQGWDATDWNSQIPTGPGAATTWDANLSQCTPTSSWTPAAGGQENLPINCVDWYEAYAFCIWDGGFLPTNAEWDYAAVGGSQQREYPWGSTAPGTANQYAIYGDIYGPCTVNAASCIAPIGTASLGAGCWGQLDLVGELDEWMLDSANPDSSSSCTNCAYVDSYGRSRRGGDFATPLAQLPTTMAVVLDRTFALARDPIAGIRCARAP